MWSLAAQVHSAVSVINVTDEQETVAATQKAQKQSESGDVLGHVKEVFEKSHEELGECDKLNFAQLLWETGNVFSLGPEDLC